MENSGRQLTNVEIADRLLSLAQLLSTQKENPFKIKAYRRASKSIRTMSESLSALVLGGADLTEYAGIGKGISGAIQEIVESGTLSKLEGLRAQVGPEVAAIAEYPRLDPARVLRIYKKLGISSVEALKENLTSGEITRLLGARMDQHVRQALLESHDMLLFDAEDASASVERFLLTQTPVTRVESVGAFRRKVEIVSELSFLIETDDFPVVLTKVASYGGKATLLSSGSDTASFQLPSGVLLHLQSAFAKKWGIFSIAATGSDEHVGKLQMNKLAASRASFPTEASVYQKLGLSYIEPELREGHDEIEMAARGPMPLLITAKDIRGELHAHSTSSDGAHTIEQMARAALKKGYEYTGITDHSQSLKIAGGLSEADLWKQIRFIDKLNAKGPGILILKSAEVDILEDGSLDYPDDLLRELDYTVCSIHSKFVLGKLQQTERILRAMDNRYLTILGHATGRRLLKRTGYEIDVPRVIDHAKKAGCFFEINSSPERLDFSAENARLARDAGVKIAIDTDAHSTGEYDLVRCGIEQARRAGLQKDHVLNTRSWPELKALFRR